MSLNLNLEKSAIELEKETSEDFAEQLGHYLMRVGFTQQELAYKIGMHRNTIVKWMNRTSWPTSRGQILRLADELSLSKQERKDFIQAAGFSLERWPTEVWTVPQQRDTFFTGRDGVFSSLREHLIPGSTMALTQAISGLGGIGKTHTAVEYAYRFHQDYEAVLWLQADSWETLVSACIQLVAELELPEQKEPDQVIAEVQHWLRKHRFWLLILDNVEHQQEILSKFVPTQHQGSVLMTTRVHDVEPLAQTQVLSTMSENEGILFLLRRTKKVASRTGLGQVSTAQHDEARQIWHLMDGLPLALDQAGAYILETSCSFSNYREQYARRRAELLDRRGRRFIGHEESVATTFSLAFERVEALSPAAADTLRVCSLLSSEAIPEEIFREGAQHLGPLLASGGEDWNLAIGVLQDYSLAQRNSEAKMLTIHRLVQAVLKDAMDTSTYHLWANRVVQAIEAVLSEVDYHPTGRFERFLAHAQSCAGLIEQCHLTSRAAAQILYRTGAYLAEHAQYAEAEALYVQSLHIRERVLGSEHPEVAYPLYALAELCREQGKFSEAEVLYQRILRIDEQTLSPEHLDGAFVLHGLAELYNDQGRYGEAESLYQRALHIYEQVLDPEHPRIVPLLHNLANLYLEEGKQNEAELLYQRALCIEEQAFGPDHHQIAHSLNSLANIYLERGKYNEAESLYSRAVLIYERAVGSTNAQSASPLNNLGKISQAQGKYEEAESLYQRALHIREQALGLEHPDLASPLNGLANLYWKQGKYSEAESLNLRALHIQEQASGLEHPDVAIQLDTLANLYADQSKYEEAEPLYQQAIHIYELVVGAEHSNVAALLNNLAELYREQEKYKEAEPLYQRAVHIREKVFGPEHLEVAKSLHNLASLYGMQGKNTEAIPLLTHALSIFERELGPHHSQTIAAHQLYGLIQREMGREAGAIQKEVRGQGKGKIRKKKRGKAQPLSLQQEHDIQYKRVHERLSNLDERASKDIKEMCSLVLHTWEEAVLEESKIGEAFALYGFPSKAVSQLVPENRIHEGHNPRPWTGVGSEQMEGNFYVVDVDQNPFEVDDDSYSAPLPLNIALQQALAVTNQRFFTEDGHMKQPNNPECQRIYQGLLSAARVRHMKGEIE